MVALKVEDYPAVILKHYMDKGAFITKLYKGKILKD